MVNNATNITNKPDEAMDEIQKLLIYDFYQLHLSFEKRLFLLKVSIQKQISIVETSSNSETLNEDGTIDISTHQL